MPILTRHGSYRFATPVAARKAEIFDAPRGPRRCRATARYGNIARSFTAPSQWAWEPAPRDTRKLHLDPAYSDDGRTAPIRSVHWRSAIRRRPSRGRLGSVRSLAHARLATFTRCRVGSSTRRRCAGSAARRRLAGSATRRRRPDSTARRPRFGSTTRRRCEGATSGRLRCPEAAQTLGPAPQALALGLNAPPAARRAPALARKPSCAMNARP